MKLTLEEIKSLAFGFVESTIENGGIEFYRFSTQQFLCVDALKSDYGVRAKAQASIRLDFETNSEYFSFAYDNVQKTSSRSWYYFSLLVDGKPTALIGEDNATACRGSYQTVLPKGNKRITLFFPNLYRARIQGIELSDGSYIKRMETKKRFVFYGDSITHGYDAKSSNNSYVNRIAYAMNAEVFNFGIGGAVFHPRMIDDTKDYNADAVFVAYGTNDWAHRQNMEELSIYCEDFFTKLVSVFKNIPIYVILPIWRANYQDVKQTGTFQAVKDKIIQIAKKYENTQIINLFNDIPHELSMFSDGLHPNDDGFAYYAQGVLKKIKT